jgi:recombination protein RecA
MSLEKTLAAIDRDFGAGSVLRLTDDAREPVEAISTGALTLDLALGVGGLPRGRIVEIYGPESSGKTTVVQHVIANAQAMGLTCAMIDAEHAFDPQYACKTGVSTDDLLFSQPSSGEEALEIAHRLVLSGEVGVVAIDSVAALTPRAELAGEMGDATVGAQARLMGQAMRKLPVAARTTNTLILFVNQLREKVGVMFGSPETQPGGRALKFFASQRLDIRRIATDKNSAGEALQNRVRVKVVKNKVAAPYKQAEFAIRFGEGIDTVGELLDMAINLGVVKKSGSWFDLPDVEARLQGWESARAALATEPDLMNLIREEYLCRP